MACPNTVHNASSIFCAVLTYSGGEKELGSLHARSWVESNCRARLSVAPFMSWL
jgi:hypothetical protein